VRLFIFCVFYLNVDLGASHSKTWPASMALRPAQTPAVSMPDFQDWIRRTKPVLCTFKAKAPEDEQAYTVLVSVMSAKSIVSRSFIYQCMLSHGSSQYATASWKLQSGTIKENALIFPMNNLGLCGAFFPLTGIPEMPQALPVVPTHVTMANHLGPNPNLVQSAGSMGDGTGSGSNSQEKCPQVLK